MEVYSRPHLKTSAKQFRRQSLASFKQLLSRPTSYSSPLEGQPFKLPGSLNADIIREVVDLLAPSDILNFSLTSSSLRSLLLPSLYHTVVLKSSKCCFKTLTMLDNNRPLCRYIRKLAVRPNYYLSWPQQDGYIDENWVAEKLGDLSRDFHILSTFDWDGLELPRSQLWEALRTNCPMLKSVFTNVGMMPIDPQSALFSFEDLTGFSMVVRHGLCGTHEFPVPEALPERCWDMLINRCPNLEDLAICSFSSSFRVFCFDPILKGTWPSLSSLTVGPFGYQSDFSLGPSTILQDGALARFLEEHSSLKYMRFLWNFKRWMSPESVPFTVSRDALPNLDTYIGIPQQLIGLGNLSTIENLDLTCEPLYEGRLHSVCDVLRRLTSLTSLDIWVHILDLSRDHTYFFDCIVTACPKLTDLHFMCTTPFTTRPLKQLLSQLRRLKSLRRFSLTKGHHYLDGTMLDTAMRILKVLPALKQINIRWARESCPNHLKQEGLYEVVLGSDGDIEGLMVTERGVPLVGPSFRRRYLHKVSLPGLAPSKRKSIALRSLPVWQRSVSPPGLLKNAPSL